MEFKRNLVSILLIIFSVFSLKAEVKDGANFFSQSVIADVNRKIEDVRNRTKKDLVVETVETTGSTSPKDYSLERAKALKVNGVYVLITRKEKKIELQVGNKTHKVFGNNETSSFKEKITQGFKKQDFDGGLTQAVDFYSDTLLAAETNYSKKVSQSPVSVSKPSSENGGFSWMGIIITGLIIFVVFRIISSLFRGGASAGGYGANNSGGMGFMGSLMTGIFGAIAGNWIYDRFFGNDSSGLFGSDSSSYHDSGNSGSDWSSSDDSYYSDSGSFDSSDDSGGGDW